MHSLFAPVFLIWNVNVVVWPTTTVWNSRFPGETWRWPLVAEAFWIQGPPNAATTSKREANRRGTNKGRKAFKGDNTTDGLSSGSRRRELSRERLLLPEGTGNLP